MKVKLKQLNVILRKLDSVVVAFSGGLDSTYLLKASVDALGRNRVLAVTARSETYPAAEYREAKKIARQIGARHIVITTDELKDKNFSSNPVDRCYYCKSELFRKLSVLARNRGIAHIVDGTNRSDLTDIRHGRRAASEFGVKSPLLDAGLNKDDIRQLSKAARLSTWQKPPFACLASRIPFHIKIRPEDLLQVEKSEEMLRKLGFTQVRVRKHGTIARIEVYSVELYKALNEDLRQKIIRGIKRLGFAYVTIDLEGYRTGSMHI